MLWGSCIFGIFLIFCSNQDIFSVKRDQNILMNEGKQKGHIEWQCRNSFSDYENLMNIKIYNMIIWKPEITKILTRACIVEC